MSKKRLAFVVQRYGEAVNGGSEAYCREVAEKLKDLYEIDILTTCAEDYVTWANKYDEGISVINGVTVRRFKNDKERNQKEFDSSTSKLIADKNHSNSQEVEWMEKQGPYCPKLLNYIKNNRENYDYFIFMTYLYYTTYFGLQCVPEKSILIPTAHDEFTIYFNMFYSFFNLPRKIIYLTDEEKQFVNSKFNNDSIESDVVGLGIDYKDNADASAFREKFKVYSDFIVYVGRIDQSKGCDELFDFFLKYKKEVNSDLKLVLIGKSVMEIPKHKDIIDLGFLSEEDKLNALDAAKFLILPSKFESLSMSVLESLAQFTPVLVNGTCQVLKGHCKKSNAGLYYYNYMEFKKCVDFMISKKDILNKLGINGHNYILNTYNWKVIVKKFIDIIE